MTKNEIKEFILESDLLNEDQVENTERIALKEGISFFDALLKLGFLDQEILSKITMRLIGIPAFNLKNYLIDLEIYKIIPEPVSLKHNIISFKEEDDLIYIAFCDTKSLEIIDDLFSDSNKKIKLFYVEYDDIQKHKKKYHSLISSEFYLESEKNLQNAKKIKNYIFNIDKNLPLEYYSDLLDDKYIENFINILLEFAIFSKASFIYLNTSKDKIKILFRIKGKNYEILKLDVDLSFSLFNKLKLMADINIKSKNVIEEASFSKLILDNIYDFVLTITQNDFNESISIEVKNFSDDFKIINFNLSKKQQELLLNYSETNKGIVCIRSSNNESSKRLLYSFLEREVKKDQEVYSIEDFVSYQVGFVNQISTPKDKDFHSVLFKILSNKPDVISVEKVTKTVFPILFNYAGLQKKIFLSANKNIEILID
ncbi:MAG: Flp pilus assembly complex ATPase component TadA [Candidatus Pacebacteria bacterium]|nr:Flp pilus assembly complex ATPase component TadA [Candidatus Paceibacterota bacterium]